MAVTGLRAAECFLSCMPKGNIFPEHFARHTYGIKFEIGQDEVLFHLEKQVSCSMEIAASHCKLLTFSRLFYPATRETIISFILLILYLKISFRLYGPSVFSAELLWLPPLLTRFKCRSWSRFCQVLPVDCKPSFQNANLMGVEINFFAISVNLADSNWIKYEDMLRKKEVQ